MIVVTNNSDFRVFENEMHLEKPIEIPKGTVIKALVDDVEKSLTLPDDMIGMFEYGDYIHVNDITHELELVKRMGKVEAHIQLIPKDDKMSHRDYLDEVDPQVAESRLEYRTLVLPNGHLTEPKARLGNFLETEEPCGVMSMNIKGNYVTLGLNKDMVNTMSTVTIFYRIAR